MIHSLSLRGFRCFKKFTLEPLSRVNLLVGLNNSGKTSILEAIQLLMSNGNPSAMFPSMERRGETWTQKRRKPLEMVATRGTQGFLPRYEEETFRYMEVRHLFYGHSLGTSFDLSASGDMDERFVSYEASSGFLSKEDEYDESIRECLVLELSGDPDPPPTSLPLDEHGSLSDEEIHKYVRSVTASPPISFVRAESLTKAVTSKQWEEIVLTEEEDLLVEALRILEPELDRLAVVGSDRLLARMRGDKSPVPLGSMGDGMSRILTLTIAVLRARDGFLLVDEIDTGLHHTAMADMWQLVVRTAERLNVQVFATTHSLDCIRSLADVLALGKVPAESVSVHRIEKERHASVPYSDQELVVAAERGTEVR